MTGNRVIKDAWRSPYCQDTSATQGQPNCTISPCDNVLHVVEGIEQSLAVRRYNGLQYHRARVLIATSIFFPEAFEQSR